MTYNMTNVTSVGDLLSKANETTSFWFGMMVMLFVILFTAFLSIGMEQALLASGFLCFLMSMLLAYAGLLSWKTAMMFLGIIILVIIYIAYNKKEYG